MKPIETEETMGRFEIILTQTGKKPFVYETVTGENMAKLLVENHGKIDVQIGCSDDRSWSYRKKAKELTAKQIEDIDHAIDAIWKQSAKVPLKLIITGKPMPDNS